MDEKNRKFINFRFGGIYNSGDRARVPAGKTPAMSNFVLEAPDSIRKRDGFRGSQYGTDLTHEWHLGVIRRSAETDILIANSTTALMNPTYAFDGSSWALNNTVTNAMRWWCNLNGEFVRSSEYGYVYCEKYGSIESQVALGNDGFTFLIDSIAAFGQRLFFSPVLSVWNQIANGSGRALVATTGAAPTNWVLTGCTMATYPGGLSTDGSGQINSYVLIPSGSSGTREISLDGAGYVATYAASIVSATFLSQLRNRSSSSNLPMTLKIYLGNTLGRNQAVLLGSVWRPDTPNNYRYRCTVAGTTAGAMPVYGTTIGGSTVDGTVTFICEGSETLATSEINLPPGTEYFISNYLTATIASRYQTNLGVKIAFGNSAYTSWPVDGVDVGYADGNAETHPFKRCHGQQLTAGEFKHEFVSLEDSGSKTFNRRNRVYWTEFRTLFGTYPVRASNYLEVPDLEGDFEAHIPLAGRLICAKRRGLVLCSLTADPNLPLQIETTIHGVGCLHYRAWDVYNGSAYMIAENDVVVVSSNGDVRSLFEGENVGARPVVFEGFGTVGSDWVEEVGDVPILKIDRDRKIAFVYTVDRKLFGYSLELNQWMQFEIGPYTAPAQIVDMLYHDGRMWISTRDYGLGWLDPSIARDQDAAGTTYSVRATYDLPVVEMAGPKQDLVVESVDLHHSTTAASPSLTVSISRDGGNTFPQSNTVTLTQAPAESVTKTDRVDVWQTSDSLRIRFAHDGDTGASACLLRSADLAIQRLSDDDNMEYPVSSTSSNL